MKKTTTTSSTGVMNTYFMRAYKATTLSFFTQADHFSENLIQTHESLKQLVDRLSREGFQVDENNWIMPGAIVSVQKTTTP